MTMFQIREASLYRGPIGWHCVCDMREAPEIEPVAMFKNERDAEVYIEFRVGLINARIGK